MVINKPTTDPFENLPVYPDPDVILVVDKADLARQARLLMREAQPTKIGFDLETYNERTDIWRHVAALFPYIGGKIRTAQIGFYYNQQSYAIIFDFKAVPEESYSFINTLLRCPREKRTIIGHNLAFEFLYMESIGIRTTADIFDTQIAARILSGNLLPVSPHRGKGYGLDLGSCAGRDLRLNLPKEQQTSDWSGELSPEQISYAAKDSLAVLDLEVLYTERLQDTEQTAVAKADFRVLPIMAACNANGIQLDTDKVQNAKIKFEAERVRLIEACKENLGVDNPNSPAQLLPVLQSWNPNITDTKKDTLEKLLPSHPELKPLLELKQVVKLIGTYIDPWLQMANLTNGTVHPNLKAIGADTGRMSCPTAFRGSVGTGAFTKTGKEKTTTITLGATLHGCPSSTRSFFKARPGYTFIDADFSAIEVRLAAHMYEDEAMRELALNPDIDAHRRMASKIFDTPEDKVTNEQRKVGKTANFALQYGCGVAKLHAQLETVLGRTVELEEAERAYRAWHETHKNISKRMQIFKDRRNPKYFLRSPLGRLMGMPDPSGRQSKNKWGHIQPVKGPLIHTNGVNWPVQAAGRDLLAEAAGLIWDQLMADNIDIKACHLVHDEILLEVPDHKVSWAKEIVKKCMSDKALQARYLGEIPLECEVHSGKTWDEVH